MAHNWKNLDKARAWVNKEYGDKTRGKTMTKAKQRKIMKTLWKRAERKDKRGEF